MEVLIGLAIAVIGGVLLAAVLLRIILAAVNNAFDWVIETFGNEDAVRRLRAEKRGEQSRDESER